MIYPPPRLNQLISLKRALGRFQRDKRGVTGLEYALMVGLIAVALITAVSQVGTQLSRIFCGVAGDFSNIANTVGAGGSSSGCASSSAASSGGGGGGSTCDTCSGAAVGATCQRGITGSTSTCNTVVVVSTTYPLYVWPSDETPTTWNNGTGNWAFALSPDYTSSGTALADMNGMAETNTLLSAPDSTSTAAPYAAAAACRAHGSDWYLPAMGELAIVTAASGAGTVGSLTIVHNAGGPPFTGYYWSASEYSDSGAWLQYYSGGWQSNPNGKASAFTVRCVRQ